MFASSIFFKWNDPLKSSSEWFRLLESICKLLKASFANKNAVTSDMSIKKLTKWYWKLPQFNQFYMCFLWNLIILEFGFILKLVSLLCKWKEHTNGLDCGVYRSAQRHVEVTHALIFLKWFSEINFQHSSRGSFARIFHRMLIFLFNW